MLDKLILSDRFTIDHLFLLLCGISIFLFAIRFTEKGVRIAAGHKLRSLIKRLTTNRLIGLAVGSVVTLCNQSSSATSVMLVGLTSAGLMSLQQSLSILLGANIGTSLTVQLYALNFQQLSPLLIAVGFLLFAYAKNRTAQIYGRIIFGTGLVFFGMVLMATAVLPLRNNEFIVNTLFADDANWIISLLAAAAFTAVIQSGAATIAIAITMAGVLAESSHVAPSLLSMLPIIVGANLGTSATALLGSLNAKAEARRVAYANAVMKLSGVIFVYPLLYFSVTMLENSAPQLKNQVANAHTSFNLILALLLLPFLTPIRRLVEFVYRPKTKHSDEFGLRYLSHEKSFPAIAFREASSELSRVLKLVVGMLKSTQQLYLKPEKWLHDEILRQDDLVDYLYKNIALFLSRIESDELNEDQFRMRIHLLTVNAHIEQIGDVISKNLMPLSKKIVEADRYFSEQGAQELKVLFDEVLAAVESCIQALHEEDLSKARELLVAKKQLQEKVGEFRQAHFVRLSQRLRPTVQTTTIHLDTIEALERIMSITTQIAKGVLNVSSDVKRYRE